MSWIELAAQRRSPAAPPGLQPPENAADWYKISNSATETDTTDVYVYSDIGGWFGVYADEFIHDFKKITSKNINLRLNSPGGSVFEGIAIANTIRSHPANVTVYVDGLAASIASVIALAGNRLVMMPQSQMMIHDASGGCYGNAEEMRQMADLLDKQSQNIAEAYADRTGGSADEWRGLMRAETWYSAKEAVAAGLADAVAPMPQRPAPDDEPTNGTDVVKRMSATWDLAAMFRYAGREAAPALTNGIVPEVKNVMRQFDEGDLVAAIVKHEPEHTTGRIAVVNGNAYGVIWDNPDDDTAENNTEVYRWYTDDELQWLGEGEDRAEEEAEDSSEPVSGDLLPGVSHPGGVPLAPHASLSEGELIIGQELIDRIRNAAEPDTVILEAIRAMIRAAARDAATPDETVEEQPTNSVGDQDTDASAEAPAAVQDATKKSTPPTPDQGEEEEEDEPDDEPDNDPDDKGTPSNAWDGVVAQLTISASPSADDVFNSLKEAW